MVQVLSPTSVLYAGPALSVTSFNDKGRFDILPLHANFVSIIKKALYIKADNKFSKEILIEQGGVLHCRSNRVRVFVGIGNG